MMGSGSRVVIPMPKVKIAVITPGESLFDLLPVEQQRFLLSEWTTRMLEIGEW
jgi:hypothetical protein